MDIYPLAHRKKEVNRIDVKDVVSSVFLMAEKAKKNGCNVVFFPEAGGLLLKYIFQRAVMKQNGYNAKIFSSKVTALTKSSLSKQICAILTPQERNWHLVNEQIIDFKKAIFKLPKPLKNKLKRVIDIEHLEQFRLSELVALISEIGLYVPSEDMSTWIKANIISSTIDLHKYSVENNWLFQNFRKKIIAYSLNHISDITHDTRPLFNIILSRTRFARAIHQGKIYVMDEAISRGRTLNVLEIIFKAFNRDVIWKIGVLYCPFNAVGHGNVDFVLSNKRIPLFSNRFDLIGSIVVESNVAFARYNIDELFHKVAWVATRHNRKQVIEYFKLVRLYVRTELALFIQPGILDENDLVRLLHFIFVCHDFDTIERCINLNPTEINGVIEEVSFYINMPHPLDPMSIRKCYKDDLFRALKYISAIPPRSSASRGLKNLKKAFYAIRKEYEFLELQCWINRHRKMLLQINTLLNHRAL